VVFQILLGIWNYSLKQSCRTFYLEQLLFWGLELKKDLNLSKWVWKSIGEKKFKKKEERGQALLGRPASLSAHPSRAARPPLPSPARGHSPRSTRRRPRGGRTPASWTPARPTGLPRSGRQPVPPDAILSPPLPLLLRSRAQPQQQQPPRRHCRPKLRRSPQAALVVCSLSQDHRRVRLRRGKPLRALYRGENPPWDRNLSPEFTRPCQSASPRRNLPVSAPFGLFLSALGSERDEEA